jgi:hypothetical protein
MERINFAGFPPTKELGGTSFVTTEPAATTEFFANCDTAHNCHPGGEPNVSFDLDGLRDYAITSSTRFDRMARRDQAYVRSYHHIIGDIDAAKVIHSAVLVDEHPAPNSSILTPGRIERWNERKAVVDCAADQIAEYRSNLLRIIEAQPVENRRDRHLRAARQPP